MSSRLLRPDRNKYSRVGREKPYPSPRLRMVGPGDRLTVEMQDGTQYDPRPDGWRRISTKDSEIKAMARGLLGWK